MWTPAARVQLARGSIPYETCLADAEWALVRPFMPAPGQTRRPRRWPMRLIMDAILYVLRTGCAWAHLPRDFPPPGTVHRWFLRLARSGIFERLAHASAMADRQRASREASPTAAVLDAQSARSGGVGAAGARGYDAA
jgi:transposase